jgi:hypothetical protein
LNTPNGVDELKFMDAVGSAYTAWIAKGAVPVAEEVLGYCAQIKKLKELQDIMQTREFAWAMQERGVEYRDHLGLSAKQHYALMLICQPLGRESLTARLRKAGITQTQYTNWMRDPIFSQLVNSYMEDLIRNGQHLAHEALLKALERGDMKAVEYYNQLSGRFDPNKAANIDVMAVLTGVIEIIQKNVKDPAVLQAIATELHLLAAKQQIGQINGNVYNEVSAS